MHAIGTSGSGLGIGIGMLGGCHEVEEGTGRRAKWSSCCHVKWVGGEKGIKMRDEFGEDMVSGILSHFHSLLLSLRRQTLLSVIVPEKFQVLLIINHNLSNSKHSKSRGSEPKLEYV